MDSESNPMPVVSPDRVNFENYARLYQDLTQSKEDLAGEGAWPINFRCIFPNDQELRTAWAAVDSAYSSLGTLVNPNTDQYLVPVTLTCNSLEFQYTDINFSLLGEHFPPSTRPALEARIVALRDSLLAYHDTLSAKFTGLLEGTRVHETLIDEKLRAYELKGWLLFDFANVNRFRTAFLDDEECKFEHAFAFWETYESLKDILNVMDRNDIFAANPRSSRVRLLRQYVAHSQAFRQEILRDFATTTNYFLEDLKRLNSRWAYPGEPAFLPAVPSDTSAKLTGDRTPPSP